MSLLKCLEGSPIRLAALALVVLAANEVVNFLPADRFASVGAARQDPHCPCSGEVVDRPREELETCAAEGA